MCKNDYMMNEEYKKYYDEMLEKLFILCYTLMKTYKLLKFIEPETSIPVWDTFQAGELIRLDNWNTIPADWLIEHWYIEEVKERPTSWKELWEMDWCYFNHTYNNIFDLDEWEKFQHAFKTEKQCAASIALAQITQLLDKYDIPEESKKRFVSSWYAHISSSIKKNRWWLLRFDTEEKCSHFYKHHKALIDKIAPFYIF